MSEAEPVFRRPAEPLLVNELREKRSDLLAGFESRSEILRWLQTLAIRTMGQIPTKRYRQVAAEFQSDGRYEQGVLIAAFLVGDARDRPLDNDTARELRRWWAAETIGRTEVVAYRSMRKDAGDYVGEADPDDYENTPGYDYRKQSSLLMRPSLEDLDRFQRDALDRGLDGLEDRDDILEWGDDLTNATRGEPIDPDRGAGAFIPKVYQEDATVRMLTSDDAAFVHAREAFLGRWLLPAFNRAVQDLTKRTKEEPAEEQEEKTGGVKPA